MGNLWRVPTVGPTVPSMYLDRTTAYGINLTKPESSACTFWSLAEINEQQMEQYGFSLKDTKLKFLWVMRMKKKSFQNTFIDETQTLDEEGRVVSWCPQLVGSAHETIGCFVTHSGLGSRGRSSQGRISPPLPSIFRMLVVLE
ncbi:OLC1v1006570C1 [Oldenlandia corymbosa var. corymbosa]|uniref:OLC1v1006570C1 n=1 Tax=Oldenlandia corymbosa var. corymbosa TaxID=529605 RepID=A0AAV1DIT1_OLDCO|nr:OLC1v1006570C1 [Oldenlandia corymbosa var. corymbosa]